MMYILPKFESKAARSQAEHLQNLHRWLSWQRNCRKRTVQQTCTATDMGVITETIPKTVILGYSTANKTLVSALVCHLLINRT